MKIQLFLTIILFTLLAACDGEENATPSPEVSTRKTYITINVTSVNGNNVFVVAQLKKGGSNSTEFIKVTGDDQLVASVNEPIVEIEFNNDLFSNVDQYSETQKKLLRHTWRRSSPYISLWDGYVESGSGGTWYFRTFDDVGSGGDTFYLSYQRGKGRQDVTDTYVTLPYAFNITTPNSYDAPYSRSNDDIYVSWSPANTNAAVDLSVEARCKYSDEKASYSVGIPDTGEYVIPANTIKNLNGVCKYQIRVDKVLSGHLDSHFKGGKIWGSQARTVTVETID